MRIFCSICKDIFIPQLEIHVTKCGHLYHAACILTWMKQHRTCPQCRSNLSKPFRVYFDVDKDCDLDPSTLEHQVETLSDKLREIERDNKILLDEKKNLKKENEELKEENNGLNVKNVALKTSNKGLKDQIMRLKKQLDGLARLENELETAKLKVITLQKIETLLKGSAEEVNNMIESTPVTELAVKQLCTYVNILKTQLQKLESKNIKLFKENRELQRNVIEEKQKESAESEETIKSLKASNKQLENELLSLQIKFGEYKNKHPEKPKQSDSSSDINSTWTQVKTKTSFDLSLEILEDEENESVKYPVTLKAHNTFTNWEELVCAGPSRNFGVSLQKCRSFSRTISNSDFSRSNSDFAFDGLGGRKRLRLGGPTPAEEFEKIKKKKEKKTASAFQHKISEYCLLKKTVP